jgi:CheY-like chemotaxis protein
MIAGHRPLIVEDDPIIAQAVEAAVRGLGHEPIVVTNARDAEQALREHTFCYILPDVCLPSAPGAMPLPVTGLTLIGDTIRRRYSHRNASGHHVLPIIVISAHGDPRFVSRTLEIGGDAFVDKPSFDDITILTDKICERLRLAGREDHAACEAMRTRSDAPPGSVGAEDGAIGLRLTGDVSSGQFCVVVGNESKWLTPALLRALLHLMKARLQSSDGYVTRSEMGKDAAAVVKALSRLRIALGARIDEVDLARGYRLHPSVVVEHVATGELVKLKGEAIIVRLATEIERLQKARAKR